MERWRQADGCTGEPTGTPEGNLVTTDFTACAGGVEVTFIKVTGMGHQWSEFNPDDRAVTWAFLSADARSS